MNGSNRHVGRDYIPALDGLRGVSIVLVVLSHAGLNHVVPGGLGVTIFFFISGYIITRLMLVESIVQGRIAVGAFYLRRFFRLMPALFVYLLVCIVLLRASGQWPAWGDLAAVVFYFSNYWNIGGNFGQGFMASPFTITWSLAVEEHYYLLYPLCFAFWAYRPQRLLACMALLLVAVLLWRLWLVYGIGFSQLSPDRIYMASDTRVDSILFGACLALLEQCWPRWRSGFSEMTGLVVGLALLLLSLLIRAPEFRETLRYSVQGLALVLMWPGLLFADRWPRRWLESGPMLYLGRISYSLYLYHWLVHVALRAWLPGLSLWQHLGLVLLLAWPMAYLSWRWVEHGGLLLRQRWEEAMLRS